MATTSFSNSNSNFANPYISRSLCQIVGLVCLAGFAVDMLVLATPPDPLALEWRASFLRQMSDRSIVLLFGTALVFYGSLDSRRVLRQLALLCLVIGLVFNLTSILVIRDSLLLQQQAITTISSQANQVRDRIEQIQANPPANAQITPEQIQQAFQTVKEQSETLKQNARTGVIKSGFASVGNLLAVGWGLLCLGRYGLRLRRTQP